MPRRKPAADTHTAAAVIHRLCTKELDELLRRARVPEDRRANLRAAITQQIAFYNNRLARRNAPSAASQAESFRKISDYATDLLEALAGLPPALRMAVEPDYRAFVRRMAGEEKACDDRGAADQQAVDEALLRGTTVGEAAALPPVKPSRRRKAQTNNTELDDLLSRAGAPLPLELVLTALISMADERQVKADEQVSRGRSKQRGTFWRNQLARQLKGIGVAYSPTLASDEREAENWVALALEWAGISYPKREANSRAFNEMFGRRTT